MLVSQNVILLFVGFWSFAGAEDDKEYDYEILKTMLRDQAICPTAYQEYISNCTQKYDNNIKQCGEDEEAAKLKHQRQSTENRQDFLRNADRSCTSIIACDSDYDYEENSNAYGCLSEEALKSAVTMTDLYYEAKAMKSDYENQIKIIEGVKNSCTNTSTWLLSNQNKAALDHLSDCFRTGKWQLFEALPVVLFESLEAPAVSEDPEAS